MAGWWMADGRMGGGCGWIEGMDALTCGCGYVGVDRCVNAWMRGWIEGMDV